MFDWLWKKEKKGEAVGAAYVKASIEKDTSIDIECYWPQISSDEEGAELSKLVAGLIITSINHNPQIMLAVKHAVSAYGSSTGMDKVSRTVLMLLDSVVQANTSQRNKPLIPPSEAFKGGNDD